MNITIRITRSTITFTAPNTVIEGQTDFEQYNMKTGIAVAANLRQALAECHILKAQSAPGQIARASCTIAVSSSVRHSHRVCRHSLAAYPCRGV